ncbi:MAG TPA: Holliday junction branch migration protein RuvA [Propioniciclava sp.]|uniref:Holliday junction branch migration protein RuvA n=1 Tax=Propioniciclava sp. TaxID=2038686 RepID=UPI002B5C91D2|nr:Holliday junction branch migration protein RuvA [Propioniciclava sp.]HRL49150.1 Holliday junction branch migration protein RuvA [Propioniciclava sp.]HRL79165.1 Holliday junction branch migration protein RuvA [Propioniciclava sp.]
MIAHLTGTVSQVGGTWVDIDLGGFGVRALATPATVASVTVGKVATLATSLVVRQDSLTLFGFSDPEERDAFEMVQTASGIGPKLAQAVVSVLPPAELRNAILSENLVALTKVPGIGRKGAQKMVIELKEKVNALGPVPDLGGAASALPGPAAWRDQVASGLESLGWSARDAAAAVEGIAPLQEQNPALGIGELMRAALQSLAR